MILGMNLLVFILMAWVLITALAWLCEYGPEIYREKTHSLVATDSEMTAEVPLPHDPDKTIVIPKIEHELQVVFVINKQAVQAHRRHARA